MRSLFIFILYLFSGNHCVTLCADAQSSCCANTRSLIFFKCTHKLVLAGNMILRDHSFKYGPYSAMEVKIFFEMLSPPESKMRAIFDLVKLWGVYYLIFICATWYWIHLEIVVGVVFHAKIGQIFLQPLTIFPFTRPTSGRLGSYSGRWWVWATCPIRAEQTKRWSSSSSSLSSL